MSDTQIVIEIDCDGELCGYCDHLDGDYSLPGSQGADGWCEMFSKFLYCRENVGPYRHSSCVIAERMAGNDV